MDNFQEDILQTAIDWLGGHGIRILGIVIAILLVQRFSHRFIEGVVRRAVKRGRYGSASGERKREDTIIRIFNNLINVLVWIIGGMMILSELGLAIGPLLAAAGIAGVALGFGGQYLIRDIISGFFMLVENQYRVGDVVMINNETSGLVEDISLRLTTLRDLDGVVHHIPNGNINLMSNMTKQFSRINLNVSVSYKTELEKAVEVINRVGKEMSEEEKWKEDILDPPAFLRVDDFTETGMVIKILGETKPARQWDATGELRRRLKQAFDKEGIEIPLPQRIIHQADDAPGGKKTKK